MIGEDKVRIMITVTKDMKKNLEELAKNDNRNVSNFIVTLLRDHIDKNKPV